MRVTFNSFEISMNFGDSLEMKLTRRIDDNNQEHASMKFFKNGEEAEFKMQKIANLLAFTADGSKTSADELVNVASSCFLQILDLPVDALQDILSRARDGMSSDEEDSMETQTESDDGPDDDEEIELEIPEEELKAVMKEIFNPVFMDIKEFQTLFLHFFIQSYRRV